jgi:hypothetical protein
VIEKKDSNPNPGAPGATGPTGSPDGSAPDDENPWDEDDGGGRTLAQEGPSFEMPSNIPSPITVPPPAAAAIPRANPVKPRSATMMGFGPPGPALPGQTGPGLPMGGGMGFTPAGGVPVTSPAAGAAPAVAPPSAKASAVGTGGPASGIGAPPSSNKRPPPVPPRPVGPAGVVAPAPPRAGAAGPSVPSAPAVAGGPSAPKVPPPPVISSNPPPAAPERAEAEEEPWANASQQEDGPTMAVASPVLSGRPLRDDLANPRPASVPAPLPAAGRSPMASTGYRPQGLVDKDAETMALGGNDPRLPRLDGTRGDDEVEETTRAVSRDELIRHQDASFVVGEDAMGDEATLAVAPGQIDLSALGQSGIAAALAESIKRESAPSMPGAPAFPPPQSNAFPGSAFHNNAPMGSSGHLAAAQPQGTQQHGQHPGMSPQQPWGAEPAPWGGEPAPWGGEPAPWGGEQAAPWSQPQHAQPMSMGGGGMQQQQGYDPMLPGPQSNPGMPGAYPQSGQFAQMQPQSQPGYAMQGGMGQGGYGPNANAATAQQPHPMGMPGQPPPWMAQPSAPGMSGRTKFTPQVILLVAVGAVCLAIFIIGIVLFVTTKF